MVMIYVFNLSAPLLLTVYSQLKWLYPLHKTPTCFNLMGTKYIGNNNMFLA